MTATAKKASQEISSNATPDSPRLPWPIPAEGFKLEVARFYYNPTERHNGGEWLYFVKVRHDGEGIEVNAKAIALSAWREREDYITKRRYDSQFVSLGPSMEIPARAKNLPEKAEEIFDWFVSEVRAKAEQDEARYQRVVEAWL